MGVGVCVIHPANHYHILMEEIIACLGCFSAIYHSLCNGGSPSVACQYVLPPVMSGVYKLPALY